MSGLRIEVADTFGEHVEEIRTNPSIPGQAILIALVEAVKIFQEYDWRESRPELYSAYGNALAFRFHPDYVITFQREETAKEVILRLSTIQKA